MWMSPHVHALPVWGQRTPQVLLLSCYSCSFVAGSLTDLTSKLCDFPVNTSPVLELQACDAILGLFSLKQVLGVEQVLVFSKQVLTEEIFPLQHKYFN